MNILKPYGIKLENIYFDITIAEYLIDSMSSTSYECSAIAMKYLTKKVKIFNCRIIIMIHCFHQILKCFII